MSTEEQAARRESASEEPIRSSRDHEELRQRLERWLRAQVDDPSAGVGSLSVPAGSGMSSETILFDASWAGNADVPLVARLAPALEDVPVFPTYDLKLQFDVLGLVRERSGVPVPNPRWLELDGDAIGSPFFVMDRESGRVPADIPPYVFEGWLLDSSPAEQRHLQDQTVKILADLHSVDIGGLDVAYLETDSPGESPLRRLVNYQRWFYDWTRGDRVHPIVEESLTWLDANWPNESPACISWGDARIGNVMYAADGFDPVAVFDWEMATIAPPEADLGWMVFLHSFFQNIAEVLELPGLPDFMRGPDVAQTYARLRGVEVEDLHWFEVFAATRHAIIMGRIRDRQVHFGEAEWADDVDEAIPHRDLLRSMLH